MTQRAISARGVQIPSRFLHAGCKYLIGMVLAVGVTSPAVADDADAGFWTGNQVMELREQQRRQWEEDRAERARERRRERAAEEREERGRRYPWEVMPWER